MEVFFALTARIILKTQSADVIPKHHHSPRAAQLLPTALAATAEAPYIRNNGAAAHQHQWAKGGPVALCVCAPFLFLSYDSNEVSPHSLIYDSHTEIEP